MIARADVEAALALVFDPCSVQAGAPLSVMNMGLVTRIDIAPEGVVCIGMRATSPWCTMLGCIMEAVERTVRAVHGVRDVLVEVDAGAGWSEADLSDEGRRILGDVRERSRAAAPVRRRQWRERLVKASEV